MYVPLYTEHTTRNMSLLLWLRKMGTEGKSSMLWLTVENNRHLGKKLSIIV